VSISGHEQTVGSGRDIAANIAPKVCALWSSPLTRCIETSANIMASVSVACDQVYLNDNLLERMGRGHVCNHRASRGDIVSRWPLFKADALPDNGPVWTGAEPATSVRCRMQMLVRHLQQEYAAEDSPVIVVSHHDALLALTGKSLKNGEYVVFDG
jgi:broad specificity phosphatase PhoE